MCFFCVSSRVRLSSVFCSCLFLCIMFSLTIPTFYRCSITRLLQFGSTLVKKEDRYVIDLKNNPDSPAAHHKSVKYHKRSILPLPKMLMEYLDALSSLRKNKGFVFLNSKKQQYSTSAWTTYVQASFKAFGVQNPPGGSALRSVYVTWLNGV